jgi:hypothetical protein
MTTASTKKAEQLISSETAIAFANAFADYKAGKINSWSDLQKSYDILPPAGTVSFNAFSLRQHLTASRPKHEARKLAAYLAVQDETVPLVPTKLEMVPGRTYGDITLYPEQQAVVDAVYADFFVSSTPKNAALQDGEAGSGKTYFICGLIAEMRKNGIFDLPENAIRPHKVIIFTPATAVEQFKRVVEEFGLGDMLANRDIMVINLAQLGTPLGDAFVETKEDLFYDPPKITLHWRPIMTPVLCAIDESQDLNNHDTNQTKRLLALVNSKLPCKFICCSATPWEKVNDAMFFSCAAKKVGDVSITRESFAAFAQSIDKTPDKPNKAAGTRLRQIFAGNIYSFPFVKWPAKAVNTILLTDFASDKDKDRYHKAHSTYVEKCRKLGKNDDFGQFEAFVALGNFRRTVEPLRVPFLLERTLDHFIKGDKAVVIGCAYKQTIIDLTFKLCDAGVSREHDISIIWGGSKRLDKSLLMSKEELDEFLRSGRGVATLSDEDFKRLKTTILYMEDAEFHDETQEEQFKRHKRMEEYGLTSAQSLISRQKEIDKFQSGKSRICLFTLAAGGRALSLDQSKPFLLPRRGYCTPVFNGKEGAQFFGRTRRRKTISDVENSIVMMRNTVEELVVAPILDKKLACIGEVTNRKISFVDLYGKEGDSLVDAAKSYKLRDNLQAMKDAENDTSKIDESDDEE